MMQVGPAEAELNLCQWLGLISDGIPTACLHGVSTQAIWLAIGATILASVTWYLWPPQRRRSRSAFQTLWRRVFPVPGMSVVHALYNGWLEPAGNAANSLLVSACGDLYFKGDATQKRLAGLVQRVIDDERAALARLSNAINGIEPINRDDLQERTAEYFRAYQGLRTQIAEIINPDARAGAAFKAWLQLDAGFLDILRHVSARPQFSRLLAGIKRVGWGEQQTSVLSQAGSSGLWTSLVDVAKLAYEATKQKETEQ